MTFDTFYKTVYLPKHSKRGTKIMHTIGLLFAYLTVIAAFVSGAYWYCAAAPLIGYWWAFTGHWLIEHNTPATFQTPVLAFFGDHRMTWDLLRARI